MRWDSAWQDTMEFRMLMQVTQLGASVLFVVLYIWSTYVPPAVGSLRNVLDVFLCAVFALEYALRVAVSSRGRMKHGLWPHWDEGTGPLPGSRALPLGMDHMGPGCSARWCAGLMSARGACLAGAGRCSTAGVLQGLCCRAHKAVTCWLGPPASIRCISNVHHPEAVWGRALPQR